MYFLQLKFTQSQYDITFSTLDDHLIWVFWFFQLTFLFFSPFYCLKIFTGARITLVSIKWVQCAVGSWDIAWQLNASSRIDSIGHISEIYKVKRDITNESLNFKFIVSLISSLWFLHTQRRKRNASLDIVFSWGFRGISQSLSSYVS